MRTGTGSPGRPRKTAQILQLSGAWDKNPARKRFEMPKAKPLEADPPKELDKKEKRHWLETVEVLGKLPTDVRDKRALVILAKGLAAMDRAYKANDIDRWMRLENTVFKHLVHFGMTPLSRLKFATGTKPVDEDNPFSKMRDHG